MKSLKNIIGLLLLTVFITACKNETAPEVVTVEVETAAEEVTLDPNATYAKAEFTIEGMTCAMGCAKTIEKKMAKLEGVKSATVDFDKKLAMVEYDEAKVTPTSLEEVVKKAGDMYSVTDMHTVSSSNQNKLCKMACCEGKTDEEKANCQKACCADKADSTDNADAEKTACAKDCKKACCADKAETPEASTDKKMACKADCKMACCTDKGKA
ncbi:heavy-metal-associated domain-containing protein [Formosa maritima]|uniref:Heavy-metal-associated domain-containing protein n=1 Tax=Formosa maritima TaxID=2592046 RepID=A0A5D0G2W4_9FLAO|nr:heavy metal-associated domain-containing protein [Formosa maritima]TYA52970.1 heavy-metal-associated domain-containing protein [Formosa maritima]